MTILTSQNMRVAHTTGRTDHFRIKNGLAVIQCPICISIHTYGITYSFFTDVVTCKVGEQISHIIFFNDRMLLGKEGNVIANIKLIATAKCLIVFLIKFTLVIGCQKYT